MFSCTLIGHSSCEEHIKEKIYKTAEQLILENNVTTFYIGTHGAFDRYAYYVLCDLEKLYDIKINVVLAYLGKKNEYCYFSNKKTLFPDVLERTPLKFAIYKRNMYMIENSEFMICYMDQTMTNTYTFVKEAIDKKLNVVNIGTCVI